MKRAKTKKEKRNHGKKKKKAKKEFKSIQESRIK